MNEPQRIGINVSEYVAQSATGAVKVVRLNGQAHYSKKMFHPETGVPTPILVPLDEAQVKASLAQAEKDVAAFTRILADMKDAKELIVEK